MFSQKCKPVIIHSVFTAIQTCNYSLCFHSNANLLLFTVVSQQWKPVIIHSVSKAMQTCYYSQRFDSNINNVVVHTVFAAMQTCYYSQCFNSFANLLLFTVFSQQWKSVIIHRVFTAM